MLSWFETLALSAKSVPYRESKRAFKAVLMAGSGEVERELFEVGELRAERRALLHVLAMRLGSF